MGLVTVHLSKAFMGSTIAKIYKDADPLGTMEITLPEFTVLRSGNFTKDEQIGILCKLGKHKEQLLILAQKNCAIDL